MKTRDEIIHILAEHKPELAERFKVRRLAVFGSWARGEQHAESDVDILVDVDSSIGLNFVTLVEKVEELLELKVDLVSFRAVNPRARKFIEKDLIYV